MCRTRQVAVETAAGNPIASLVARLRLDRNLVVLRLRNLYADEDDDDDDEEEEVTAASTGGKGKGTGAGSSGPAVEVELDLSMGAYANACRMYGHKKVRRGLTVSTRVDPINIHGQPLTSPPHPSARTGVNRCVYSHVYLYSQVQSVRSRYI